MALTNSVLACLLPWKSTIFNRLSLPLLFKCLTTSLFHDRVLFYFSNLLNLTLILWVPNGSHSKLQACVSQSHVRGDLPLEDFRDKIPLSKAISPSSCKGYTSRHTLKSCPKVRITNLMEVQNAFFFFFSPKEHSFLGSHTLP